MSKAPPLGPLRWIPDPRLLSPVHEPDAALEAEQDARIETQATCLHDGDRVEYRQRGETWIVCLDCGLPLSPRRVVHGES